ncbi:hypothetical protein FRC14_000230 [Serendipita sp. 396]|nr:hypothetical protein FRC14_000230 [Serendipita sp. 396]KAG8834195.1 hypothetical protein FRC18_002401 [Serendipita sp. 400]
MPFITRLLVLSFAVLILFLASCVAAAPVSSHPVEQSHLKRDIVRLERRLHINWHKVGDFFKHVGETLLRVCPIPIVRIAGAAVEAGEAIAKKIKEAKDKHH